MELKIIAQGFYWYLWFVVFSDTWFDRGGDFFHGSGTGVFAFGRDPGSVGVNDSFRDIYYD